MPIQRTAAEESIFEVRRQNLLKILETKGARTRLAVQLGCNQSHITHLLQAPGKSGHRQIPEEVARQIEIITGMHEGELDRPPGAPPLLEPCNPQLLEDAVRAVIATAADSHAKLVADKAAGVVRMVYENSVATGKVDPVFVAQLVRLMR